MLTQRFLHAVALVSLLGLAGCNTTTQLLRLQRNNLAQMKTAESHVRDDAATGMFEPERYDLHLFLNSSVFNDILRQFDNTQIRIPGKRPVDVTLRSVRFEFRPGYPAIQISAIARDVKSGITAELIMAAVVTVETETSEPRSLYLRVVATDVAPDLKWGPLSLRKWAFARRLLALKGLQIANGIPRVKIPIERAFAIGGPPGEQTVTLPTGDGSITGIVRWPGSQVNGTLAVNHILFLANGLHIFANVEGL